MNTRFATLLNNLKTQMRYTFLKLLRNEITMKKHVAFFALSLLASNAFANDINWSTATGYPFFVVPTISTTSDDVRYYANYKLGLDDGVSVGAEWLQGQHAMGVFVGAVGARRVNDNCLINSICISLFDDETTNGVGLSYEYKFSNTAANGWALRFEGGYGKESRNDEKRFDGNIQVVYHY